MSEPKPTYDAGFQIKQVALIGYGYWGKKVARVLKKLGVLRYMVDKDVDRWIESSDVLPQSRTATSLTELLGKRNSLYGHDELNADAVVIATPPDTHYALAAEALSGGLHVFVEKPMTTNYNQAVQLETLAREKKLHLAVGHIYLHCPGLRAIPLPVGQAELYVKLLNVAGAPSETTRDLLWAGIPHAASIAGYFFPDDPILVTVRKGKDRLQIRLWYFDSSTAVFDVADWTGMRRRDVELRGVNERYTFNADKPLEHYDHYRNHLYNANGANGEFYAQILEPLELELRAFLRCEPDGVPGSRVVKILESIKAEIDGCKS